MKLAIMQPYLFPYIGYFQLINAVDKFIIYDDVTFIKQGWINRNNILLNGKKYQFTLPVDSLTSFKRINETRFSMKLYNQWFVKFEKTLLAAYKKAPYFQSSFPMIVKVFKEIGQYKSISDFCTTAIIEVNSYLGIKTIIEKSSVKYENSYLKAEERVIDICRKERADVYINAIGGKELYEKTNFKNMNISLFFLEPIPLKYKQFDNEFVPSLSIIDCLMFNSKEKINEYLLQYSFI